MKQILSVFLVILSIGIVYKLTIQDGQLWITDFQAYIHHAKNIAEGVDYNDNHFIFNSHLSLHPKSYPPLYPLILAPIYKIFGNDLIALKTVTVFLMMLALLAMSLAFYKKMPFFNLVLLLLFYGLNYKGLQLKEYGADILFLFLTYVCLYCIELGYDSSSKIKSGILSGFFLYLLFATKHTALTLVLVFVVYDFCRNKKITRYATSCLLAFFGFVLLQSLVLKAESLKTQLPLFKIDFNLFLTNLRIYAGQPSVFFENGYWPLGRQILFVVFSIFSLLGFIGQVKNKITICEVFFLAYPIPLLFWVYTPGIRLLLPITPLYFYYGFQFLLNSLWVSKKLAYSFLVILSFVYLAKYSTLEWKKLNEADHPLATEMFDFVRTHTKMTDVIIFDRPTHISLLAERTSTNAFLPKSDAELFDFFKSIHATHFIKSGLLTELRDFEPAFIQRNATRLKRVFANPMFEIFELPRI